MDLMKVFDQTVRDLKREVNKKVLKVPEIEQKVLDATSNEPWGPHGTVMGEIAQATRNFNEYQMIMAILWKRLMDTGRNWRHVYKSLTVLEFLVAHGAERVIDELLEHTYQIQSLVDFQYVEPNGKDQGINIQKKAQSLISLINDRDKIREVRQKAATNRDKYHGISSTGGIHKSSSYSSTYGGYGNNKPNRDEDEYGRYGGKDDDSYGGSKDRDTGRYRDDHYSRERYRDDDDYGNGKARDGRQKYNDREPDLDYDDDDNHYSSRSGTQKVDAYPHEDRQTTSKTLAPSYEEAFQSADTKGSKGITTGAVAPKSGFIGGSFHAASVDDFDDFDPRAGTIKSVPATGKAEPDFFGSSTPDFFDSAAPSSLAPKATSLDPLQDLFADTNFQSSSHVSTAEVKDNFFAMPEQKSATPGTTFLQPDSTNHILASNAGAFDLFSSTSTSHTADLFAESTFTAFESASKSNNIPLSTTFGMPPPAAFEAFPEQNKSGTQPFGFFSEPASHSLPQQASTQPASFQHGQAGDPFRTNGLSQAQQKGKFEPKSSVWADSLTSGLIDLNITAPKSNALAELGINLGTAGMKTEWKPEEKVQSMSKGKAMGSGSGLGIAAASGLPPPPPPPTLGANMGMGIAQGFTAPNVFGNAPGIGINMNVGAGGNGDIGSGLGMGSGFGMPAGMQMNSTSGTGSGPGMGMGMGMRSVGGYTNTQHQFGSFM